MLPDMDPKIFSLSAVIVGYLLIDDLTANEQNALGNWLMLVAQVLCTNAFYKQVLSERKIKNSINEEELLQKFVEVISNIIWISLTKSDLYTIIQLPIR